MIIWFSIVLKPLGNDDLSPERLRTEIDVLNAGSRRPLGFRAHRLHQNVVSWKRPLGRSTSTWRAELWHSANRGHFPPFRHLRARATTRCHVAGSGSLRSCELPVMDGVAAPVPCD